MHPIMQNTNICLCRKENKTLGGASTKATWHRTTDFLSCAWWLGEVSVADRGGVRAVQDSRGDAVRNPGPGKGRVDRSIDRSCKPNLGTSSSNVLDQTLGNQGGC